MKRFSYREGVLERVDELREIEADFHSLEAAIEHLLRGRELPSYFRDHPLRPPLAGYRSCIVGHTSEDNTIIAVYRATSRNVVIYVVDEHDLAYEALIESE